MSKIKVNILGVISLVLFFTGITGVIYSLKHLDLRTGIGGLFILWVLVFYDLNNVNVWKVVKDE